MKLNAHRISRPEFLGSLHTFKITNLFEKLLISAFLLLNNRFNLKED